MEEERYFHKIDLEGWKGNPEVFLKFKIRYASLISCLHGMKYMIESLPSGEARTALEAKYKRAYALLDDEIQSIFADTFNCGWWDQQPSLDWIGEDDYLELFFPIGNEAR